MEGKTLISGHLDIQRDPRDLLRSLEGRGALEPHCAVAVYFSLISWALGALEDSMIS